MMNSTSGVLFINTSSRQGPWAGGNSLNEVWSPVAPYGRMARYLGHYTPSSVSLPIPFLAESTAAESPGSPRRIVGYNSRCVWLHGGESFG